MMCDCDDTPILEEDDFDIYTWYPMCDCEDKIVLVEGDKEPPSCSEIYGEATETFCKVHGYETSCCYHNSSLALPRLTCTLCKAAEKRVKEEWNI